MTNFIYEVKKQTTQTMKSYNEMAGTKKSKSEVAV